MPSDDDSERDPGTVFSQCSSCGTVVVSLAQHRCAGTTDGSRPDRRERQRLADDDPRDGGTEVGIFPNGRGNRYAYHDLDGNGWPRCGCQQHTKATSITVTTLESAREQGRSPCRSCERIRRLERRESTQ